MNSKTRKMVMVAILSAMAYAVMFLEFAIPIFPSFLKMDFSDLVALIGALALGPIAGMAIELVKNLLHWATVSSTGGVGELANFVVGSAFVMTAGFIYSKNKTKMGALIALVASTVSMVIAGALVNYFITIPLYGVVLALPEEAIVGMGSKVIPAIHDKFTLILYAFCPFNLIKSVVLIAITMPLYKRVSPLLKK